MEVEIGAQEEEIEMLPEQEEEDEAETMVLELLQDDPEYTNTLADIREKQDRDEIARSAFGAGRAQNTGSSNKESEGDNDEPASPIRTEWPADSVLKPEHFTIDQQKCLACNKSLGYAMPMNRTPKVKYLFCGTPECQRAHFLQCWACGKYQSENTAHLVHRPGNSAYHGPSQIYSFMCNYCYREQLALEPGVEETKKAYEAFRKVRQENEERDFPSVLKAQEKEDGFASSLHTPVSRKRSRLGQEA